MIAGQFPRREWRNNLAGQERMIEEAVQIAMKYGVKIPEDVEFFVDECGELDEVMMARSSRVVKRPGQRVWWDDLVNDITGKVPFRLWPGLLKSDEAIVAVIAHEIHELERLRPFLQDGSLTIDDFITQTEPGRVGNYHDEAWDVADDMVDRMREVRE